MKKLYQRGIDTLTTMLILVFLAIVGVSMIRMYNSGANTTNRLYLNVYASNLLKSATETSILNVLGHNFNNGCPNTFKINDRFFDVTARYHFFMNDCGSCQNCSVIKTKDTNASFIVNVTVKSKVPGFNIVKTKTTIQNP